MNSHEFHLIRDKFELLFKNKKLEKFSNIKHYQNIYETLRFIIY